MCGGGKGRGVRCFVGSSVGGACQVGETGRAYLDVISSVGTVEADGIRYKMSGAHSKQDNGGSRI